MKLVHWPLMDGLLHLVQQEQDSAGPQPVQAPPRCTKCNSLPINGQCTSHRIAVYCSHVVIKGLNTSASNLDTSVAVQLVARK